MNVVEAVGAVLAEAPQALYVASLGTTTAALRQVSGDGPHLYMGGAMGSALAVALGLAEARRDHSVVALLGDGELLMSAGTLWSVAAIAPANLLAVVFEDGLYIITGGQRLGPATAFADVAAALPGLAACSASSPADLRDAVRASARPGLVAVHIDERVKPAPSPFVDPALVRVGFGERLGLAGHP